MSALRFPQITLAKGQNTLSLDEFRQLQAKAEADPKKSSRKKSGRAGKFNATAVESEHGRFDSKMEYQRFLQLQLLERAGQIKNLRRQISYPLTAGDVLVCTYIADFVYEENGREIVEDSKGFKTKEYLLKKRLMKKFLGIEIFETGHSPKKNKSASRRS